MKNNSLHDIFQKIWLEKNRRGQPFTSVANNFLHLLRFEIGHPTVLLNKRNMVIVVVFTQKMIRHFKDEKYLCEAVQRHRTCSSVGWGLLSLLFNKHWLWKRYEVLKNCSPFDFSIAHSCLILKIVWLGNCPILKNSWLRHY